MTSTGEAIFNGKEKTKVCLHVVSRMPDRSVANCRNTADPKRGIFMHMIPFYGDSSTRGDKTKKKRD